METTKYKYDGRWGEIPALRAVCSLLRNHKERHVFCPVEIGFFFTTFADGHAAEVQEIRTINAQIQAAEEAGTGELDRLTAEKKRSKTNAPCIIPAAYYSDYHTADSLYTPSGLLCVDIDRHDNPEFSREDWGNLPASLMASKLGRYCAFIGESRSGWEKGGYFVLIPLTGADDFPARFAALEKWMEAAGVKIDHSAKNVNHCRALTIQDNSTRAGFPALPVVNADAIPYGGRYHAPQPRPKAYTGGRAKDYERARRACKFIKENGINIADDFGEWTRIAFAFAAAFGEAGEALFLQVAAASPKFRTIENAKKFRNALQTNSGRVDLATFWHLCKRAGVKIQDF